MTIVTLRPHGEIEPPTGPGSGCCFMCHSRPMDDPRGGTIQISGGPFDGHTGRVCPGCYSWLHEAMDGDPQKPARNMPFHAEIFRKIAAILDACADATWTRTASNPGPVFDPALYESDAR